MRTVFVLMAAALLPGCESAALDGRMNGAPSLRVSGESSGAGAIQWRAWVEGADGDLVTGATILGESPSGILFMLAYDPMHAAYTFAGEHPTRGDYTFTLRSALVDSPIVLVVPVRRLESAPTITTVSDAHGANAMDNEALDPAVAISIGFLPTAEATSYVIRIARGITSVFESIATHAPVLIPAGTLDRDATYTVSIQAQSILGDPYFVTHSFSSISISPQARVYVETGTIE